MPLRVSDPSLKDLVKHTRKVLAPLSSNDADDVPDLKILTIRTKNLENLMRSFNYKLSSHCEELAKSNLLESQLIVKQTTQRELGKEDQLRTLDHMAEVYAKQIEFYTEETKKLDNVCSKMVTDNADLAISKEIDEIKAKIKAHAKIISQQKRHMSNFWLEQEKHFAESVCSHNEALFRLKYFEIKNEELTDRIARINEAKTSLQAEKEKIASKIAEQKNDVNLDEFQEKIRIAERYESVLSLLNKTTKDVDYVSKKYTKMLEASALEKENLAKESNNLRKNIDELGKVISEQHKMCVQEEKRASMLTESLGISLVKTEMRNSAFQEKRGSSRLSMRLKNSVEEGKRMSQNMSLSRKSESRDDQNISQTNKSIKNTSKFNNSRPSEDFDSSKVHSEKQKENKANLSKDEPKDEESNLNSGESHDDFDKNVLQKNVEKHPDIDNLKTFDHQKEESLHDKSEDSKLPSIFSGKKEKTSNDSQISKPKDEFGFNE